MAPPRCLVAKMSRCKLKYALPLYVSSASLTYLAPVKFPDQVAARTQQPGQAVGPELPDGRRTEIRSATRGETAGVSRSPTAPGPPGRPPGPVLPPRPAVMRRALPPLLRGRRVRRLAHLVPGLRAGRVHDPGDVAPAGQHITDIPAHQAGRLVRRGPGHDVVVDGAHHVGVVLD